MDNGFGTNLEGFLIHGNLSLNPGVIPAINGDGSIEASGTFYIDKLREYNNNNGIDIQNVIFSQNYVSIPFNIPSNNSTTGTLVLNGGLSIRNTSDATSLTSGGTITTLGGVSIGKRLNVGGQVNVNNNKIINVSWPTNPLDAANKAYVDSRTGGNGFFTGNYTAGQVLIGGSSGNVVGFPNFVYNQNTGLIILNTSESLNLSSSSSLTTYGGVNIYKTLNVGDIINVNNNKIINVAYPTDNYDAVNKLYVDDLFNSIGGGGGGTGGSIINLNFSTGQILIGGINESIIGRDTFIYSESYGIFINNSTDASGLGTGGALTITGGLSVDKRVFIGGGLDVNMQNITSVASPINGFDAVNKNYLTASLQNLPSDAYTLSPNNYENLFILENDVVSPPLPIPLLTISPQQTLSFITYIYVNVHNVDSSIINSLFIIYSFYDGTKWIYNSKFTGFISDVQFYVVTDENFNAVVSYTNTNLSGVSSIKYYVRENMTIAPNTSQVNYTLLPTLDDNFVDFLSFLYNEIVCLKIHVYISVENSAAFFTFDLVFKNDEWVMYSERIGSDINVEFNMNNLSNIGTLQYKNLTGKPIIVRVKQYRVLESYSSIQLYNNTFFGVLTNVQITNTEYATLYIYVGKPELNQYTFFTIEVLKYLDNWYTNTSFRGDFLNVFFQVNSNGYLTYSNPDPINYTFMKVLIVVPNKYQSLPITSGGTGNTYLEPYSILIGNGTSPIIHSTEFIYKDCTLHMYCKDAQIIIYNTTDATGVGTGGNLTLYGGASINKSLYVGNKIHVTNDLYVGDEIQVNNKLSVGNNLYVNNVNITPSSGDLTEYSFYATNNQTTQASINNFYFDSFSVQSFIAQITITITRTTSILRALVILKGLNTSSGWILRNEYIGDTTGIQFFCDNTGQINYTSTNISNWISTKINFRASTTSL